MVFSGNSTKTLNINTLTIEMSAKYIAIVDNELDIVDLFKEALEMKGYYVSAFTNPLLALNHILKDPTRYSLIISDFRMPEMNGDELVTKLLETKIKVILMSALS
jgi:DNA-binding NtrC family response regulator